MENIKSWILSIVLSSIAYSLIDFLLPSGHKTTARLILNMFFLLCILMPLKSINFNKILPNFEIKNENQINSRIEYVVKKNIESVVLKFLKSNGAKSKKINISIDESTTPPVFCKIDLISCNEKPEMLEQKIEKELKIKAKISFAE